MLGANAKPMQYLTIPATVSVKIHMGEHVHATSVLWHWAEVFGKLKSGYGGTFLGCGMC